MQKFCFLWCISHSLWLHLVMVIGKQRTFWFCLSSSAQTVPDCGFQVLRLEHIVRRLRLNIYRVSQEEWARLRENVP